MTALAEIVQSFLLLVLLAVLVGLWRHSRTVERELLDLRSREGRWAGKLDELASEQVACSSRLEAVSVQVLQSGQEISGTQTAVERALAKDRAEARRTVSVVDAAVAQLRQELSGLRDDLSAAVASASAARAQERRRQAAVDKTTEELNERLRDLEARMGDFLHGCDELVRAEIMAQLADSLPVVSVPGET